MLASDDRAPTDRPISCTSGGGLSAFVGAAAAGGGDCRALLMVDAGGQAVHHQEFEWRSTAAHVVICGSRRRSGHQSDLEGPQNFFVARCPRCLFHPHKRFKGGSRRLFGRQAGQPSCRRNCDRGVSSEQVVGGRRAEQCGQTQSR
jgi:hypothetical protein